MPAPVTTPTTTPTIAPSPSTSPWPDEHVSPDEICIQQHREGASPDVEP